MLRCTWVLQLPWADILPSAAGSVPKTPEQGQPLGRCSCRLAPGSDRPRGTPVIPTQGHLELPVAAHQLVKVFFLQCFLGQMFSFWHQHFTILPLCFQLPRGWPVFHAPLLSWISRITVGLPSPLPAMSSLPRPYSENQILKHTRGCTSYKQKIPFVYHCISLDLLVKPKFLVGDKLPTDITQA